MSAATATHNHAGKESFVDKIKDKLHVGNSSHTTGTTHTTTGNTHSNGVSEGTVGPHSSKVANAADPRIDSDADHRANPTSSTSGYGTSATGTTNYSTNNGPHSSNLANKVDPRVDSDRDHRADPTSTTGGYGTNDTGAYSGTHTGNTGFTGTTGTQNTGGLSNSTNAGPHDSNLANKVDPRVDSDLDGRGNRHGASTGGILGASGSHATRGSGTAQNTDGPHNSDMANKLDPRVDSDRDGSATLGGNRTNY